MAAAAGGGQSLGQWFLEVFAKGYQDAKAQILSVGAAAASADPIVKSLASAFAQMGDVVSGIAGHIGGIAGAVAGVAKQAVATVPGLGLMAGAFSLAAAGGLKLVGAAVDVTKWVGEKLVSAAKLGAATILGLATAGLAGTVEGNRMAYAWQQLSREIAAVALPVFEKITDVVMDLVDWFRSLSGGQQDNLLKWGGLATGVALFATGIGAIPGLILAAVSAFKILQDYIGPERWQALKDALGGVFGKLGELFEKLKPVVVAVLSAVVVVFEKIATVVGWIIGAVNKLLDALAGAVRGLGALLKSLGLKEAGEALEQFGRKPPPGPTKRGDDLGRRVTPASSGFEAITESYRRIQQAITQVDYTRQTADNTARIAAAVDKNNGTLDEIARNTDLGPVGP